MITLDLLFQLIKEYPLYTSLFLFIGLIQYWAKYKNKIISFFPTDEKELNKLNKLIKLINPKKDGKVKKYLTESKRKLLFKMATGLVHNKKNKTLYNFYFKNKELGEWIQFKQISSNIKIVNNRLFVKYDFFTKLKFAIFFSYWGSICLFTMILYFAASLRINESDYIWLVILTLFGVFSVSSFMVFKQYSELTFLKLLKEKINK